MRNAASKLAAYSVSKDFFPPHAWQGVVSTREKAKLLNGKWLPEIITHPNTTVSIYDCYPYLFLDAFPQLHSIDISDFSLAGKLFASSLFYSDRIMDLDAGEYDTTTTLAHVMAMQAEAYMLLQSIFPPSSPFWQHFRSYLTQYFQACLEEKKFAHGEISWNSFHEKTAFDIATGKAGVERSMVAGLTVLAGDATLLESLTESINLYHFAHQMFDDLYYWKQDYLKRFPSLLLCNLLQERPVEPKQEDLKALTREVYYGGHACTVLQLAVGALERAHRLVADLPHLPWHIVLTKLRDRCEGLLYDILKITQESQRRAKQPGNFHVRLPADSTPCGRLARRALQFLIRQWQLGFGEARHLMHFSHAAGFTGKSEMQYGDIFQRAVIADILWEAAQAFQLDLQRVLDFETNYLLEHHCRDGIGGWSYFPNLPELAPDADDLAQMIQVLLHTGRHDEIARYCETPLATLLSDNCHEDGSLETWIIPRTPRSPKQERQLSYAQNAWGTGGDVDVMANLLYALALYDHVRFAEIIDAGIAYIEAHQQADGSWLSTWYHGPYYGTFVCVRLLARVKPDSLALERAQVFLTTHQMPEVCWGLNEEQGDPLSTALALLSYFELARLYKHQDMWPAIQQALAYLHTSYDAEEKAWPNCEFIRMELGRPSGQVTKVLSYGSKTITTAFVLKAATAWHSLLDMTNIMA
jgi:squalene-hopene/tetraprenyl-beta-curcumene cyclase